MRKMTRGRAWLRVVQALLLSALLGVGFVAPASATCGVGGVGTDCDGSADGNVGASVPPNTEEPMVSPSDPELVVAPGDTATYRKYYYGCTYVDDDWYTKESNVHASVTVTTRQPAGGSERVYQVYTSATTGVVIDVPGPNPTERHVKTNVYMRDTGGTLHSYGRTTNPSVVTAYYSVIRTELTIRVFWEGSTGSGGRCVINT